MIETNKKNVTNLIGAVLNKIDSTRLGIEPIIYRETSNSLTIVLSTIGLPLKIEELITLNEILSEQFNRSVNVVTINTHNSSLTSQCGSLALVLLRLCQTVKWSNITQLLNNLSLLSSNHITQNIDYPSALLHSVTIRLFNADPRADEGSRVLNYHLPTIHKSKLMNETSYAIGVTTLGSVCIQVKMTFIIN